MDLFDLSVFWYCIIIIAIMCYAMLDGFDLGVGILHLFVKEDYERRVFINAIGPLWDGNAVWLIIILGGLFAGFPYAYATLLSAFYTPVMFFIAGLILRTVAIEFRSKRPSVLWRKFWDFVFFFASLVIGFGAGILMGNFIHGIAINEEQVYMGDFWSFINPYTVLVGITAVACFTMHGALFLVMKTEGELHDKLRSWVNRTIIFFIICYAITTVATLIYQPHMAVRLQERPVLFLVAILSMLAIANIPREINKRRDGRAFLSSAVSIALLLALYGIGMFPVLLRSSINPELYSLTVHNSDASHMTLTVLAIIVLIGLPLVGIYGFITTRIFRGKVKIDHHSY
ncbi:MAG: cytochrome d ubiquinol oxidase subunit II [Chlamydiales bacterium]|nr:cytochrome d ubiquinol oxidase subunit II [Chlamydiales bacterium]